MSNKEIKNFWENKHETDNIPSLSGCEYEETIDMLKINEFIKNDINVLEVGVGMGYVTKGLYDRNMNVSVVDISEIALKRVENYSDNLYNSNELIKLPSNYFDLIICMNVVQHIPTKELKEELKEFMRSLKVGGIFAVEFVSSNKFDDNGTDPKISIMRAGALCRTPNFLENIFLEHNGECKIVFNKDIEIGILRGQHVFHVTKTK